MGTYLPPIEQPHGLIQTIVYFMSKKQFGKVPTPVKVVYSVFDAKRPLNRLFLAPVSRGSDICELALALLSIGVLTLGAPAGSSSLGISGRLESET